MTNTSETKPESRIFMVRKIGTKIGIGVLVLGVSIFSGKKAYDLVSKRQRGNDLEIRTASTSEDKSQITLYQVSYTEPADHYGIQQRKVNSIVDEERLNDLMWMTSKNYLLDFKSTEFPSPDQKIYRKEKGE